MTSNIRLPRRQISGAPVDPLPRGCAPSRIIHTGHYSAIELIDVDRHADELYTAASSDDRIWDYMAYGPFPSIDQFNSWLHGCAVSADPMFFAIRDLQSDTVTGMASYLDIQPQNGVIEIGHIWMGTMLQNTTAATEALYLMMRHAMDDLGYRRLYWKCNALNAGSRRAATRLGFEYEAILFNHIVVKGCNRDTAYYSILDTEWEPIRANFERWLASENFDADGRQRESLGAMNRALRPEANPEPAFSMHE